MNFYLHVNGSTYRVLMDEKGWQVFQHSFPATLNSGHDADIAIPIEVAGDRGTIRVRPGNIDAYALVTTKKELPTSL